MPKITFTAVDGTAETVSVEAGSSVMRAALDNGIDGVVAECGGACACATCQVLIDLQWVDKVPAPDMMEQSMLDEDASERGMPRRLSCQITATDDLDGLIVHLPTSQY